MSRGRTPFLEVSSLIVTLGALRSNSFDERGLLGLACHPDVQQNGRFHTYMSVPTNGSPTLQPRRAPDF